SLVPVLTTINLQHTLRIDVQPLSSVNNFAPPGENTFMNPSQSSSSDINIINPGGDDFSDSRFSDDPKRENSGNNLVNPFIPKDGRVPVNINFNPQVPKDPSKIYARNPFLNSLSSTSRPGRGDSSDNLPGNRPIRPNLSPNTRTTEKTIIASRTNSSQSSRTKNSNTITTTPFTVIFPTAAEVDLASKDKGISDRPYSDICGRTVATNSLVVNGNTVPRGAYPWLVALFGVKATGLNYMCSGTLISDRHIVTAAHCVKTETKKYRPQELLIILGKLNIQKWVPMNGEKMIEPESIHIHPDYEPLSSDADIAVLVLSESVQFTKYIRPLCLWSGRSGINAVVGKEGTVVGWGKDENGDLITAEPRQTNLPIVSQEQCLRSSYQFQYITSNRTFCAGK
ncbi:hypothetical protein NQ314_014885, partial [Rhamnusium bicolor]